MRIAYRQTFDDSIFRDVIIESLYSKEKGTVHIAAGFFSDFMIKHQKNAPEHNLLSALSGKTVFLYGIYNKWRDRSSLANFRDTLSANGIEAKAYICSEKWHAKTFFFHSDKGPLLGIVGSSNATGPSFDGLDPFGIWSKAARHTIECDTYLWTSEVDSAVGYVFSRAKNSSAHQPSLSALPDYDVEQIIHGLQCDLGKFAWNELP